MEVSLIIVIVVMFYFCVIFPLQMRRYLLLRKQRQNTQRLPTANNPPYPPRHAAHQHTNNVSSEERSDDHRLVFGNAHTAPTGTVYQERDWTVDDAATRHLEAEHRQQIIEIQREIEQQARNRNASHSVAPKIINSSTVRDTEAFYSQQVISLQREIERQAIQRQEERRPDAYTPHMPPRLSSTTRSSVYTITPDSTVFASNSTTSYPYAPPLTPDVDGERHINYPVRLDIKANDELPSYEQALALGPTTTSATATTSRF